MAESTTNRNLGLCQRTRADGRPCEARALVRVRVNWSGQILKVCGAHLARMRRKLGNNLEEIPGDEAPA